MAQSKNSEYVNADNLERLLHGNLSTQAIAEELGRNRTTLNKWLSDGRMPRDASLACEALLHRHSSDRQGFLLVRGNVAKMDELKPVLEAFGFEYKEMGGPF